MDQIKLQEYLDFAKDLAGQAGKIMLEFYRINQSVEIKNDRSPVTIADTKINALVIKAVQTKYPDHGILGEEASWQVEKDNLWVCDPIDGTAAYTVQIPVAMFSLAFVVNGEPLVSVNFNPITNELYTAIKNGGSFLNGNQIKVSTRGWEGQTVLGRSASGLHESMLDNLKTKKYLEDEGVQLFASMGCVFKSCLVSTGSFDGYIFEGTTAHDIAAIKILVEEAGGRVTDLNGNEQPYNRSINGAIVSNGLIHSQLVEFVGMYANTRH